MFHRFIVALGLLVSTNAFALEAVNVVPLLNDSNSSGSGFGVKVFKESLQATRYTGWFPVPASAKLVFEIDWNDVTGDVSEIEMVCRTARDTLSFGSGGGYQITTPVENASDGRIIYKQQRWRWAFADGDTSFEWQLSVPAAKFIECGFSAVQGSSSASDELTVFVRSATP